MDSVGTFGTPNSDDQIPSRPQVSGRIPSSIGRASLVEISYFDCDLMPAIDARGMHKMESSSVGC